MSGAPVVDEPEAPKAPTPELADQMQAAAEKLRSVFKEQMDLELDYDEAGVRWLEGYIDRARLRASDEKSRQGSIHLIGAFLGECTIRSLGGQWATHEDMLCVVLKEGGMVFPHNKVTKQFNNGTEGGDSILGFYRANKALNEAMFKPPTPEQERLLEHARHDAKRQVAADTLLTLKQLARGNQLIKVSYGAGEQQTDDRHYFSTTLENISSRKIRIDRFGGFKATEEGWQLASVTGDFYTADQFREWYGQQAEWLLPGDTVCDTSNWGSPPVLWAYHGVTDTGEAFMAGQVLEKPVGSPSGGSGAHFVKPVQPQPELEQIINKLRASYELRQQRMNAITLASVVGPRPSWLKETDGLHEFFEQQKLLLTEGHIVWGALVQANSLMFKPGEANCPGLLVHSPDSYFDARPQELRLIGHTFFSFKHTEPTDPELKEVARLVTDELDRSMGFELPTVFSSKPVRSATFMVFRQHVPNGVLSTGLFPILTHPSTQAVMMVPFEFWPIELIVMWKEHTI